VPTQCTDPDGDQSAACLARGYLHTCSQGILGFERGGLLPSVGVLDGLVVGLRPDGELAWGCARRGTRLAGGARAIGGPVKTDADDRIARHITSRPPVDAGMLLEKVRLLGLPIEHIGPLVWYIHTYAISISHVP
jgi:hypothetical protein